MKLCNVLVNVSLLSLFSVSALASIDLTSFIDQSIDEGSATIEPAKGVYYCSTHYKDNSRKSSSVPAFRFEKVIKDIYINNSLSVGYYFLNNKIMTSRDGAFSTELKVLEDKTIVARKKDSTNKMNDTYYFCLAKDIKKSSPSIDGVKYLEKEGPKKFLAKYSDTKVGRCTIELTKEIREGGGESSYFTSDEGWNWYEEKYETKSVELKAEFRRINFLLNDKKLFDMSFVQSHYSRMSSELRYYKIHGWTETRGGASARSGKEYLKNKYSYEFYVEKSWSTRRQYYRMGDHLESDITASSDMLAYYSKFKEESAALEPQEIMFVDSVYGLLLSGKCER